MSRWVGVELRMGQRGQVLESISGAANKVLSGTEIIHISTVLARAKH